MWMKSKWFSICIEYFILNYYLFTLKQLSKQSWKKKANIFLIKSLIRLFTLKTIWILKILNPAFLIIVTFLTDENVFRKNIVGSNYVICKNGEESLVFDFIKYANNQPKYKSAIKFRNGNYKKENHTLCGIWFLRMPE